jgi:hypothetical protein
MQFQLPLLIALAALVGVAPARAQSTTGVVDERVAWAELGLGGALTGVGGGGALFPSAAVRVNVSRHDAVDLTAAFFAGPYARGLSGFYVLEGRHTFPARTSGAIPFATYGIVGGFTERAVPEYSYQGVVGGGGARARLNSRAYVEASGELCACHWGLGLVARAGIMVPIGPTR